jgi:DNA-binding NarL/FixJ family response regulator
MATIRILFVDDSTVQRDAFRTGLEDSEYELVTVSDTASAQRAMRDRHFDIAVIDYNIGDELGDQCLRALKQDNPNAHTRYFLYTTDPHAFRRHRDMGFDGVLMLKGKASVRLQIDAIARVMLRGRSAR